MMLRAFCYDQVKFGYSRVKHVVTAVQFSPNVSWTP